jgi:catechol 2,3-dioxygenase-like lactoylglutathione lyase family enzyme
LPLPLAIDHAVIAVRDLDAALASFRALGFTLTPRGYHSIGSQNHCIMLGRTYIELLAAPAPHPWLEYYRTTPMPPTQRCVRKACRHARPWSCRGRWRMV